MNDGHNETNAGVEAQLILLAASNHNIDALRTLLRSGSASVQDIDTGYTPLHSAIAACDFSPPLSPNVSDRDQDNDAQFKEHAANGNSHFVQAHGTGPETPVAGICNGDTAIDGEKQFGKPNEVEAGEKTVRLLLQNGAIWNDLDKNNETPGCLAKRLGLSSLYDIMVDAGVRAEMLLSRLDRYELLLDVDEDGEGGEDEEGEEGREEGDEVFEPNITSPPSNLSADEAIIGQVTETEHNGDAQEVFTEATLTEVNSTDYLHSNLTFNSESILDEDKNGVMMVWETGIMERTAELLAPDRGLRVLNIGHGMGIIDDFFQKRLPSVHHIIEAHPDVLEQMKKNGWVEKPGVTVHKGKWQEVVPKLIDQGTLFDAIYFDTFAEDYKELHKFFEDNVIGLLEDGGKWGFFNGLGADRQICYDVYTKVVEMDLLEAGYDVEWETIFVPNLDRNRQWEGIKRPYWRLEAYRLPVCTFIG
ncbi:Arginine N-methyltransferase 2 [Xylographa trunciseda]|nr:Arginine N-methyltransferase 2 [Xylographa trunciseda]